MRRLVTVLLAVVGMTAPAAAPPTGRFGGTFIAVIVTQDGILVGSDSRSTFVTSTGKPVGYVDQMTKIYVNQRTAVAVAGLTSVEDELFSSFIRRNDYLLASSVSEMPGCTVTRSPSIFSTRFIFDRSSCVPPLAVMQRVIELAEPTGRTGLG